MTERTFPRCRRFVRFAAQILPPRPRALPADTRDTRVVIDRLSSLRELPDGAWKLHAGDLAHGEAVNLDESGWQPIANAHEGPQGCGLVSPDLSDSGHAERLRPDRRAHLVPVPRHANGPMPEILYFNGRRVAMGDDLEPVVLFDNAKPGDKVTVAVKLLHTVDDKNFRGATLKIDFPESRPNPEDLREEFLSAALLVPALAPGDAANGHAESTPSARWT
jgi:alpha-mannosidase